MRKLVATSLFLATMGLPLAMPRGASAEEVTVEKKTTTTSPSGTVVIENETSRTFKLQGHSHVYTAPADVDLKAYNGKEVTVTVDPMGNVTKVEKRTTTHP
jgi:hypothetical protein